MCPVDMKMNRPNQSKPLLSGTDVEENHFDHLKDDRKQITFKRSLGHFLFLLNVTAILSGNFSQKPGRGREVEGSNSVDLACLLVQTFHIPA